MPEREKTAAIPLSHLRILVACGQTALKSTPDPSSGEQYAAYLLLSTAVTHSESLLRGGSPQGPSERW